MHRALLLTLGVVSLLLVTGCQRSYGPRADKGVTYYCPGAGNFDMGDAGIREGLRAAGYRGEVARLTWSVSFNPAIDQSVRIISKAGAANLARCIEDYMDRYPGRPVNVVGLSAGTGVAIFALEELKPGYDVNNVVLLGSSLSYNYDVSKALRRVRGNIYVWYSSNDAVLAGPMKVFGTIDGQLGVDGAGAVGLRPRGGADDRIVNTPWRPEFARYGYHGGHLDCTSAGFVRKYVAPHILSGDAASRRSTAVAMRPESAPPAVRPN
jgi:pimeloyl-ACP methyl ester carboxylesterase